LIFIYFCLFAGPLLLFDKSATPCPYINKTYFFFSSHQNYYLNHQKINIPFEKHFINL
jgi:hypothetical protein